MLLVIILDLWILLMSMISFITVFTKILRHFNWVFPLLEKIYMIKIRASIVNMFRNISVYHYWKTSYIFIELGKHLLQALCSQKRCNYLASSNFNHVDFFQ